MSALNLLVLVLAVMAWIYGTAFDQKSRTSALNLLIVDFDQGPIGDAVIEASKGLSHGNFLSVDLGSLPESTDIEMIKSSVCRADYWAALYTHQDASERLISALNGTSSAYDPSDAVTFIYNHARYPTVADAYLSSNLQTLVGASVKALQQSSIENFALDSLNVSNEIALEAFFDPIRANPDLIRPMPQASRALYNTFNVVIPPLSQFFLILSLNGIGLATGFLATAGVRNVWLFRFSVGKAYSFLAALVMTGCMWAFREGWEPQASVFAKTWMIVWLAMDINWQIMESVVGSFLPMAYTPFFVLPWVVINIASTLWPVELMPDFYRVSYASPMRASYVLLIEAWSGCGREVHISLPVLFAWWIVGHATAWISIRKRCNDAAR